MIDCGTNKACFVGYCDPINGCLTVPANGKCDDNDPCTVNDQCNNGQCSGTFESCDDNNPCTADLCFPGVGCNYVSILGACDDNNPCTSGTMCALGQCKGGTTVNCNDNNGCTQDLCDPQKGCVSSMINCDDGNKCTVDLCDVKIGCKHPLVDCGESTSCATVVCSPSVGCVTTPLPCNDNNPCTVDTCVSDVGCTYIQMTGPCDDGDPCTLATTCKNGVCGAGNQALCDDSNPCTVDQCQNGVGCKHTAVDCNDGEPCTVDYCDNTKGCVCVPTSEGKVCDDGNLCSVLTVCKSGQCSDGFLIDCADNDPCTDDLCNPDIGCEHIAVGCSGLCCEESPTVGCGDSECEACVCEEAPLCCEDIWDQNCVELAQSLCGWECGCGGCAPVPGDINDSGITNVVDVQCAIMMALWWMDTGLVPAPTCSLLGQKGADINCDMMINVTDVLLATQMVLGTPLSSDIDFDGDNCPDECLLP